MMATDAALRFANVSLSLYRHEGTFTISVGSPDELDAISEAFEAIGCEVVEKDSHRLILTIATSEAEIGRPT